MGCVIVFVFLLAAGWAYEVGGIWLVPIVCCVLAALLAWAATAP